MNKDTEKCIDVFEGSEDQQIGTYPCKSAGGAQAFAYTQKMQIAFSGDLFLTVNSEDKTVRIVRRKNIDDPSLAWSYNIDVYFIFSLKMGNI